MQKVNLQYQSSSRFRPALSRHHPRTSRPMAADAVGLPDSISCHYLAGSPLPIVSRLFQESRYVKGAYRFRPRPSRLYRRVPHLDPSDPPLWPSPVPQRRVRLVTQRRKATKCREGDKRLLSPSLGYQLYYTAESRNHRVGQTFLQTADSVQISVIPIECQDWHRDK